ncbi:heavy metal-associated isoprenylated plant protein 35-like [Lolium rigidum]|uniref:heavy metal-associated isoprenylated plant protein 35-like n=1 Tax=Lolium rigidum TaxID=89674 RepID=UPI001F5DC7F4|nr:heavy metal-associated isoprenylated plant protein 35-like [Lolium rigidum]
MAAEPVEYQVLVLRVSIHCEGCKKKVKKVLQHVDGVFRCDIDGRRNRVTVTASRKIDAGVLIARLHKSGKHAEPWPEEPKQEQPAESQSQETKNPADDASNPNEATEKPAPEAAAEPSSAQPPAPEPEKTTEETPPPAEEKKEADETKTETAQQQPSEETGEAKQQHHHQQQQQHNHHDKPIDARVTMVFDDVRGRGGYGYGSQYQNYMPATRQPPVHVMSYNQARPMASASYYAAAPMPTSAPAPMPMPMPMSRPGPSQGGYIDEYAPPNYYGRPVPPSYEPYSYYPETQPSPYRHQRSADADYYYGAPSLPPQRSAFSPPRDAYGDMFNDENANSCSVM